MTYAAITGWGKCMPPAVLTNADLATFLETDDEWITSRTGMKERRVSHVHGVEMAYVASMHALACAGLNASDIDLIVYGSCSNDETVPNTASGLQYKLGASNAASMDVNTACTSFLYAYSTANAMIRTGVVKRALIVGVELVSRYMDWNNRGVAVLFGDGCAAIVIEATEEKTGLLAETLGCFSDARGILRISGYGATYANQGVVFGDMGWVFDGPQIFKKAVQGMTEASAKTLIKAGVTADQIDLVVPHQANSRIIESVAKYAGLPMSKVHLTVSKYGNMSAATVPVALVEALEEGKIGPRAKLLMPAFGAGLTLCSHYVEWGDRITPKDVSNVSLPPCEKTALEMVNEIRAAKLDSSRSTPGIEASYVVDQRPFGTQ
ncbi:MAG: ketoacyl-ACP synthase III [Betaproteobacteria bacterium]|nr:MAG: ketoacyl-ACP synthase III [Betaproteobacteria bacterium]TAG47181.1 MAG: ketoacyl-ACP synthase III [Betaproteobacteria bacterium]